MKWQRETRNINVVNDDILNSVFNFNGLDKSVTELLKTKKIELKFEESKIQTLINFINIWKKSQEEVLVCCDYDGDGDTSGAIMHNFLVREGVNTKLLCLDRKVGFGLHEETIEEIKTDFPNISAIVTTDNGSKSSNIINLARKELKNDLVFIVTDHHDKDKDIQDVANLFINPHYDNEITNEEICGAMVVFILINQYYIMTNKKKENIQFIGEALELASIATYTDVMPVFSENRTALKFLINRVKNGTLRNIGLKTLLKTAKIDENNFTGDDIGFRVGPMLNASGRLTSSSVPTRLLLSGNVKDAVELAAECILTNERRKEMSKDLRDRMVVNYDENVHVMAYDDAHEGLIGIIAGNLTELTGGPSFAFTQVENGAYKGSGRSPVNFNLIESATEVFDEHPDLVVGYGGHPGAMGLTIKNKKSVFMFQQLLEEKYISKKCKPLFRKYVDFPKGHSPKEVYEKLETLEPYGQGLARPIYRIVGKTGNGRIMKDLHTSFTLVNYYADPKVTLKMLWFKHVESIKDLSNGTYEVFFTLSKNEFNGRVSFDGTVIDAKKIIKK